MTNEEIIKDLLHRKKDDLKTAYSQRDDDLESFLRSTRDAEEQTGLTLRACIEYICNTFDSEQLESTPSRKTPSIIESDQMELGQLVSINEFITLHHKYFGKHYKHRHSAANSLYATLMGVKKRAYNGFYEMAKRNGKGMSMLYFYENDMREYMGL